jgi:hypothetical protein
LSRSERTDARLLDLSISVERLADYGSNVILGRAVGDAEEYFAPTESAMADVLRPRIEKLRRHRRGERWLVIYNAVFPLLSPSYLGQICENLLRDGPDIHVAIVTGYPAIDAFVVATR